MNIWAFLYLQNPTLLATDSNTKAMMDVEPPLITRKCQDKIFRYKA